MSLVDYSLAPFCFTNFWIHHLAIPINDVRRRYQVLDWDSWKWSQLPQLWLFWHLITTMDFPEAPQGIMARPKLMCSMCEDKTSLASQ